MALRKRQAPRAATSRKAAAAVKDEEEEPEQGAEEATEAPPPAKKPNTGVSCARCGVCADKSYSNFPSTKDAKGRLVVNGDYCSSCIAFAESVGATPEDMMKAEAKDPKLQKKRRAEQQDFEANKLSPESRSFAPEEMFLEVSSESIVRERYAFFSRTAFRDRFGVLPEEAKVSQVRVRMAQGDEVSGVLQSLPDSPPELHIEGRKRIVRRVPIVAARDHHFENQVSERLMKECRDAHRHFGQAAGGKYAPKLKPSVSYSPDQLLKAAEAARAKNEDEAPMSGLQLLAGELEVDSDVGEPQHSQGVDGRNGSNPTVVVVTSARKAPVKREAARPAAAPSSVQCAAADAHADFRDGPYGSTASASTPDKSRADLLASPPSHLKAGVTRAASPAVFVANASAASSAGDDLDEASSRVKPPSYWLNMVTTSRAFAGKNLTKQISWATAGATRTAATDSVMAVWGRWPQGLGKLAEARGGFGHPGPTTRGGLAILVSEGVRPTSPGKRQPPYRARKCRSGRGVGARRLSASPNQE